MKLRLALIAAALALASLASGCLSSEVRASAVALRDDFKVFRRAVVPNPALGPAEQAAVRALGEKIEGHIVKLEEGSR